MSDIKPWERQPGETAKQFLAFRIYRDLGLGRTMREAWEKYADHQDLDGEKPHNQFREWRGKNDWESRVSAWDNHQDRQLQKKIAEGRAEAVEMFAENAGNAARMLMLIAAGRINEVDDVNEVDRFQFDAILELLDRIGVKAPDELSIDLDANVESNQSHQFDVGGAIADVMSDIDDPEKIDVVERVFDRILSVSEPDGGD